MRTKHDKSSCVLWMLQGSLEDKLLRGVMFSIFNLEYGGKGQTRTKTLYGVLSPLRSKIILYHRNGMFFVFVFFLLQIRTYNGSSSDIY